jgi:hypothetical protein
MTDNFTETFENLKRQTFRKEINRIWNMLKEDKFSDLNQKEQKLAQIIMNHPEYQEHFEDDDLLDGRAYTRENDFNPFLHISLHEMAEDQVASEAPVEAALLCEYIESKGYSRHEGIHVIMTVLINLIFASYENHKNFDEERYKNILSKCKKVNPKEIQNVIQIEFTSS